MALFDFPYHTTRVTYPDNQARISFGKGFQFAASSAYPIQRTLVISMIGVQRFVGSDGLIDNNVEPQRNAGTLEAFYVTHRMHVPFTYPSPIYGDMRVRFNKPLDLPSPEQDAEGVLPSFDIELIEIP